ncbi:MAG: bifunctional phosphopantothenoylcysteine decarboxylase/phosphopantothenate--cysteine ligase CoaBC [Flavobacteriaceae bacterium]|nr:bifunctional phosphopantothenoylcysteine decarboxylase/phosphopantothenate--cysteine ligase CoaBC [Flavobacteriaceae bacterium]
MSVLRGKKVLLGITAGIAAYKTASLVRLFVKSGAEVKVVMTPAAKDFITPLTLSTLSNNPVVSSFTHEEDDNAMWNNHVELGLWADLMVIAPATANSLSKMANGTSDNLLIATYLSAKCPVYFAPAMDLDMYKHPSTKESFDTLMDYGNIMIPAEHGELASGLVGQGRMAEPEAIIKFIENHIIDNLPMYGKTVLITAGPTYEPIDPVRFIGNHSSGKMGFALARAAVELGAQVKMICGPTHESFPHDLIHFIPVLTAQDMFEAVHDHFKDCDVAIMAAAVSDYRPKTVATEKIKKHSETFKIELVKTRDILASCGEIKSEQFLVGFALETDNELENAIDKLKKKNLDLIVLNSLRDKGAGFGTSTNKVTLIRKDESVVSLPLKSKMEVGMDIMNEILIQLNA